MYRLELKKRNKSENRSAKSSYNYVTRIDNKNDLSLKTLDFIATNSRVPASFRENPSDFWEIIDKNERSNGRLNIELLITIPREFNNNDKIKLVENVIEKILDKGTCYSYAIHNPTASDDLPNPHCHLLIYEKNFPRDFFSDEISLGEAELSETFKKNKSYIEKNIAYEKKKFLYKARETLEQEIMEFNYPEINNKIITKGTVELNLENRNKNKQIIYSEIETKQDLAVYNKGVFMEEIKKILNSSQYYIKAMEEFTNNLTEEKFNELQNAFPKDVDILNSFRKKETKRLLENGYTEAQIEEQLKNLTDFGTIQATETLIPRNSDLLKINSFINKNFKKVEEDEISFSDRILDTYLFEKITAVVIKENQNIDLKDYKFLNKFYRNLKNEIENLEKKENFEGYFKEIKITINNNDEEVKIFLKEKYELFCIQVEKIFTENIEEFLNMKNMEEYKEKQNEIRLLTFEYLNDKFKNDEVEEENSNTNITLPYDVFYTNLKKNLENEFKEITKEFIYSELFFEVNNNYYLLNNNTFINEKIIDKSKEVVFLFDKKSFKKSDFMSYNFSSDEKNYIDNFDFFDTKEKMYTGDKKFPDSKDNIIKNKVSFMPTLDNFLKDSINNFEMNNSFREEYKKKIEGILKRNINYLRGNFGNYEINFLAQSFKDKKEILNNNGADEEKVNFSNFDKTYSEFIESIKKFDEKNFIKKQSTILIADKKADNTYIKPFLYPSLPLHNTIKFYTDIGGYNGTLSNLVLNVNADKFKIINAGKEIFNESKVRKIENIKTSPVIMSLAYEKAIEISKNIDLKKDLNHLIVLSMRKSENGILMLDNTKLERAKKNNLVDIKEIEKLYNLDKADKIKIALNTKEKIIDGVYISKKLKEEAEIKNNISDKIKRKKSIFYFDFSVDIEKMNDNLKKIEKIENQLLKNNYDKKEKVNNTSYETNVFFYNNKDVSMNPSYEFNGKNRENIIDEFFNVIDTNGEKIQNFLKSNLENINDEKDIEKKERKINLIFNLVENQKNFENEFVYLKKSILNKNLSKEENEKQKSINKKLENEQNKKNQSLALQFEFLKDNINNISNEKNLKTLNVNELSREILKDIKYNICDMPLENEKNRSNSFRLGKFTPLNPITNSNEKIENFILETKNKIEKKKNIVDEHKQKTYIEKQVEFLNKANIIKFSLEWENKENINDEKALKINPFELKNINKELIFASTSLYEKMLIFKIYLIDKEKESIEEERYKERQLDLRKYLQKISQNDDNFNLIIDKKLLLNFKKEIGISEEEKLNEKEEKEFNIYSNKNRKFIEDLYLNTDNFKKALNEYIAFTPNFQYIGVNEEQKITFVTSIEKLTNNNKGIMLKDQINDKLLSEIEFRKEFYKFETENARERLDVENTFDNQLELKRKIRELEYFLDKQNILDKAFNKTILDTEEITTDFFNDFNTFNLTNIGDNFDFNFQNGENSLLFNEKQKINLVIKENNSEYLENIKAIEKEL